MHSRQGLDGDSSAKNVQVLCAHSQTVYTASRSDEVMWMYTGATFTICKAQYCGGDLFVVKPWQSNIIQCTVPVLAVYTSVREANTSNLPILAVIMLNM